MSCIILTPQKLQRLLDHQLTEEETRVIHNHLTQPCQDCLELFESLDSKELLQKLAGTDAELSTTEAESMFAASKPLEARTKSCRQGWNLPALRLVFSASAVLLLVIGVGIYLHHQQNTSSWNGLKGGTSQESSSLQVELEGYVGTKAEIDQKKLRPFSPQDSLAGDEFLFFRYRLSSPAYLYLVLEETQELLWWPESDQGKIPAQEAEITSGGKALALTGRQLPKAGTLLLLASPRWLPTSGIQRLLPLKPDAARTLESCPGCNLARLSWGAEPR